MLSFESSKDYRFARKTPADLRVTGEMVMNDFEGDAVSLGEGMTPLLHAPALGRRLGLERLYLKDESRNPTGSFKDRLASSAVSMARSVPMSAARLRGV